MFGLRHNKRSFKRNYVQYWRFVNQKNTLEQFYPPSLLCSREWSLIFGRFGSPESGRHAATLLNLCAPAARCVGAKPTPPIPSSRQVEGERISVPGVELHRMKCR